MKKYHLSLLLFLFIVGCKPEKDPIIVNQFTKDDFPIAVGNWWKYKHTDFLSNTTDTILLRVISLQTNTTSSKEYTCIVEEFGQVVDTAKLILGDSTIAYNSYNPNYSYFGDFFMTAPFKVDSKWANSIYNDSTTVISYSEGVKYNGVPYNVFFLKRTVSSINYHVVQTISVAKGIGIIEHVFNYREMVPIQSQNLQLIDYHLN